MLLNDSCSVCSWLVLFSIQVVWFQNVLVGCRFRILLCRLIILLVSDSDRFLCGDYIIFSEWLCVVFGLRVLFFIMFMFIMQFCVVVIVYWGRVLEVGSIIWLKQLGGCWCLNRLGVWQLWLLDYSSDYCLDGVQCSLVCGENVVLLLLWFSWVVMFRCRVLVNGRFSLVQVVLDRCDSCWCFIGSFSVSLLLLINVFGCVFQVLWCRFRLVVSCIGLLGYCVRLCCSLVYVCYWLVWLWLWMVGNRCLVSGVVSVLKLGRKFCWVVLYRCWVCIVLVVWSDMVLCW